MNTIQINIKCEEYAALEILRQTKVGALEAALIAREALEIGRGRIKRTRSCLAAGKEALRNREKTVTFAKAVEAALEAKKDRRARTRSDFRYLTKRLMTRCPELARRRVRSIRPDECRQYLRQAFHTPQQRNKGRLALSSVFTIACKHGWCADNPVRSIEAERIIEKRIRILSGEEIHKLLRGAQTHLGGSCLAAVGLMLYAGIRPHEVERLQWADIKLKEKVISILPQHSKTGGARHVTIHPPLERLLRSIHHRNENRICPPNWRRRWTILRKLCGFSAWQPDILRHTYATHHLATFCSYDTLQVEMGHRSTALLRTRYIAMEHTLYHSERLLQ